MRKMSGYKRTILGGVSFSLGFLLCSGFLVRNGTISQERSQFFHAITDIPFFEIFWNNLAVCFLFVFGCGLLTTVLIFIQGIMFGINFSMWIIMGNAPRIFWLLFLPHVIFETAAMITALYLGFELFYVIIDRNYSIKNLFQEKKQYLVLMIGFVLVAALIECYVTPLIYLCFA